MSNRADATAVTDEGTTRADLIHSRQYVYNPSTLAWERMTQPGGGTGGGGAVTVADGADVTQGATTDLSSANTVVGILKAIKAAITGTLTVATHAVTQSGTWTVQPGNTANTTAWKVDGSAVTQPVSGTFWQATQPVSIAASVAVTGPLTDTQLRASAVPVSGTFFQATQPVSGTFWQATQPVSGPLTDTQLRASAVPVSGTFFQATQPVSIAAAITANPGTGGGKTLLFAAVSAASAGSNAIVAADATNKIKVVSYVLVADAAVTAKWQNAATDLSGPMSLAANSGAAISGSTAAHLFETSVNQALNLNLGGAVGVRGHISYFKEP